MEIWFVVCLWDRGVSLTAAHESWEWLLPLLLSLPDPWGSKASTGKRLCNLHNMRYFHTNSSIAYWTSIAKNCTGTTLNNYYRYWNNFEIKVFFFIKLTWAFSIDYDGQQRCAWMTRACSVHGDLLCNTKLVNTSFFRIILHQNICHFQKNMLFKFILRAPLSKIMT